MNLSSPIVSISDRYIVPSNTNGMMILPVCAENRNKPTYIASPVHVLTLSNHIVSDVVFSVLVLFPG